MHTLLVTFVQHMVPQYLLLHRHDPTECRYSYQFCDDLPRLQMADYSRNILRKVRVFAAACGGRTTRSSGFDVMQEQSSSRALNTKLKLMTVTSRTDH